MHPEVIDNMLQDGTLEQAFGAFKEKCLPSIRTLGDDTINGMVTCPWGKHRSVALSRCLRYCLKTDGYNVPEAKDLGAGSWSNEKNASAIARTAVPGNTTRGSFKRCDRCIGFGTKNN